MWAGETADGVEAFAVKPQGLEFNPEHACKKLSMAPHRY